MKTRKKEELKQAVPPEASKPEEPNFMLFVPRFENLLYLAAQEIGRKDGKIRVREPAFVAMKQEQTGYNFMPIRFLEGDGELYESSLLFEMQMPMMMLPHYIAWVEGRKKG